MSLDYVARCPACGRIVAAFMGDTTHLRDLARETGKWIREGLEVVRMETEDVRKADWCHPKECKRATSEKRQLSLMEDA